jgi:hypothetical protein
MRRQTRQQAAFTIFLVDCRRIKQSLRAEVDVTAGRKCALRSGQSERSKGAARGKLQLRHALFGSDAYVNGGQFWP